MANIDGTCEDRFTPVREAFAANFDQGLDVGASVSIILDGAAVVDLWGGSLDGTLEEPGPTLWQRDTITNVWSTTKTMTALCALMLADRGELDPSAPVARYWPEFKAGGKEAVTVAQLMSHSSGLSGWQEPMAPTDLYDWDLSCARLAAQEPWWEPGTASGYHAVTQGYLVGEVIRRIDGRSVGRFFAEEVAGPLGADFFIGTPASADDRVARVIPPPPLDEQIVAADPDSMAIRTLTNPPLPAQQSWDEAWRRAEIPAAGGHGNARSVARVQAVLAHGGELDGVRLLSEAGCHRALEPQVQGVDLVLGAPLQFGLGYGLITPDTPLSPNPHACFWGGWGGSLVVVDMDARMCFAYVMNKMGEGTMGDLRAVNLLFAAYGALEAASYMAGTITVERTIDAPADAVWALVADLPRMGEWSPENTGGRWLKGAAGPAVGAGFKGTNANGRRRWSTRATVTVCQPGQAFGFDVKAGGLTVGTWRYDIEPTDRGRRVTESFDDSRGWLVKTLGGLISGVTDRDAHNRAGMETTLANLAAGVEANA